MDTKTEKYWIYPAIVRILNKVLRSIKPNTITLWNVFGCFPQSQLYGFLLRTFWSLWTKFHLKQFLWQLFSLKRLSKFVSKYTKFCVFLIHIYYIAKVSIISLIFHIFKLYYVLNTFKAIKMLAFLVAPLVTFGPIVE